MNNAIAAQQYARTHTDTRRRSFVYYISCNTADLFHILLLFSFSFSYFFFVCVWCSSSACIFIAVGDLGIRRRRRRRRRYCYCCCYCNRSSSFAVNSNAQIFMLKCFMTTDTLYSDIFRRSISINTEPIMNTTKQKNWKHGPVKGMGDTGRKEENLEGIFRFDEFDLFFVVLLKKIKIKDKKKQNSQ